MSETTLAEADKVERAVAGAQAALAEQKAAVEEALAARRAAEEEARTAQRAAAEAAEEARSAVAARELAVLAE